MLVDILKRGYEYVNQRLPKIFSVSNIDKFDRKHAFYNEWSVLDYLVSFVKLS